MLFNISALKCNMALLIFFKLFPTFLCEVSKNRVRSFAWLSLCIIIVMPGKVFSQARQPALKEEPIWKRALLGMFSKSNGLALNGSSVQAFLFNLITDLF